MKIGDTYLNSNYFANPQGLDFDSLSNIEQSIFCIIVASLFLVFCLVISLSMKVFKARESKETISSKREKYQEYLSLVISNHVQQNFVDDRNLARPIFLTREDLKDSVCREILREELISLHTMLLGEEKQRLKDLYLGFGFAADIMSKITSTNWRHRIQALYEISAFNLVQFYPQLLSCLNDKDANIKKAAFSAYAELLSNPIEALEYIKGPINRWEKHIILGCLKKRSAELIPVFADFKNKFALHEDFLDELSVIFDQDESPLILMSAKHTIKVL